MYRTILKLLMFNSIVYWLYYIQRLSLDKEVMENFRKAVENMKSTLGLSALQTPEDLFLPTVRDPVQFPGPKEVISGLEVHDGSLYVSYQGKVINKFNLQVWTCTHTDHFDKVLHV